MYIVRSITLDGPVVCAWSEAECLAIESRAPYRPFVQGEIDSISELLSARPHLVAVISRDLYAAVVKSVDALIHEAEQRAGRVVVILVGRKSAPLHSRRDDGVVTSFCCSGEVLAGLLALFPTASNEELCFRLLYAICNGLLSADRVFIRQVPFYPEEAIAEPTSTARAAVVMAHRGPSRFVQAAMWYLSKCSQSDAIDIYLGLDLDQENSIQCVNDIRGLAQAISIVRVSPTPAGPYVIRQYLIETCRNDTIVFHDSDDISTEDRISRQCRELRQGGIDLVGSHELCLNEIRQCVEAARFPLDVTGALETLGGASSTGDEPLLHATAVMSRSSFIRVGGFSTDQRIANDTQFMLRAHFSLRMKNVDEFLYIRRVHRAALTSTPGTESGNPLRRSLAELWQRDFQAIRNAQLEMSASSLAPRHSFQKHQFVRLRSFSVPPRRSSAAMDKGDCEVQL